MTTVAQSWQMCVRFNGTPTDCLSARPSHGVEQPVGTCVLDIPNPLPPQVVNGAVVTVEVALNGEWLPPLFTGIYRTHDRNATVSGSISTLTCEGTNYRLNYPLGKDVVFTGGAKVNPQSLTDNALHLGNDTIAWYTRPTPDGLSYDLVKTPLADSNFVWIAGKVHGTNSYEETVARKTKKWSRIELWQNAIKLGYANFEVSAENYSQELPYTGDPDDENWDTFEGMIAATKDKIDTDDGDITFRFVSGTRPDTGQHDEYEVMRMTWQTAGKNSVREIVRGLKARSGLTTDQYLCSEVTDVDGNIVRLGGNGLADAGQVRVNATEQPISFINRVAGLFGYYDFDCPDGITRCQAVRGTPVGTSAAVFTEGINALSVRRPTQKPNVYNSVRVEGWSGTDQNRTRIAYASQTAAEDVESSDYIPDGQVYMLRISDSILTLNSLCRDVREVAEINHAERAVLVEVDTWPHALRPGQVIDLNAPSVGFAGRLWLMRVEHELSPSGFTNHLTGWAGGAAPFDGDDGANDPDPTEIPIEPGDPRPVNEWRPMRPSVELNDA